MDYAAVAIIVLSAWRITSAINREHIGKVFRVRLAREQEIADGVLVHADTFIANLISCFMCLSFWAVMLCMLVYAVYPLLLYPFAISTLVIFLEKGYKYGTG